MRTLLPALLLTAISLLPFLPLLLLGGYLALRARSRRTGVVRA